MNLEELYASEGGAKAPLAPPPGTPASLPVSDGAPEPAAEVPATQVTPAPAFESPPGLPQAYIDANLANQPLPQVIDAVFAEEQGPPPLNVRLVPGGESMCHVTDIPYSPGSEPKAVRDRIAQGPRVFLSRAAKAKFDEGSHEEKEKAHRSGPTIAHPDTLKPGTFIKGDSPPYRPG
jgi:hypothetical protein